MVQHAKAWGFSKGPEAEPPPAARLLAPSRWSVASDPAGSTPGLPVKAMPLRGPPCGRSLDGEPLRGRSWRDAGQVPCPPSLSRAPGRGGGLSAAVASAGPLLLGRRAWVLDSGPFGCPGPSEAPWRGLREGPRWRGDSDGGRKGRDTVRWLPLAPVEGPRPGDSGPCRAPDGPPYLVSDQIVSPGSPRELCEQVCPCRSEP